MVWEKTQRKQSRLKSCIYLLSNLVERLIFSWHSRRPSTPTTCAGTVHTVGGACKSTAPVYSFLLVITFPGHDSSLNGADNKFVNYSHNNDNNHKFLFVQTAGNLLSMVYSLDFLWDVPGALQRNLWSLYTFISWIATLRKKFVTHVSEKKKIVNQGEMINFFLIAD